MKPQQKEKACRECGESFKPFNSLEKYCSYSCKKNHVKPNIKLKPLYKIPQKSKKRQIEELQYMALRKVFLEKPENRKCPITGQPTTQVHHKRGRVGELFLDVRYWLAVSHEGHQKIELNPDWAKEKGYSESRLSK